MAETKPPEEGVISGPMVTGNRFETLMMVLMRCSFMFKPVAVECEKGGLRFTTGEREGDLALI
jgi:hypothetical protein